MMNLPNAAILAALVYVLVNYAKSLVPGLDGRVTQLLVFVAAIGAVFLVGNTVWAHAQVIGGHTLDTLDTGSKITAGLLIGAGSTVFDRIESAVRNIGNNNEPEPGTNP
jgi:hypothetical protein